MKKTSTHVHAATASNGMIDLLRDSDNTTTVVKAYPVLEKIMLQLQRDAMKANKPDEELLRTLKGIEVVSDALLMFKTEGDQDLLKEKGASSH